MFRFGAVLTHSPADTRGVQRSLHSPFVINAQIHLFLVLSIDLLPVFFRLIEGKNLFGRNITVFIRARANVRIHAQPK